MRKFCMILAVLMVSLGVEAQTRVRVMPQISSVSAEARVVPVALPMIPTTVGSEDCYAEIKMDDGTVVGTVSSVWLTDDSVTLTIDSTVLFEDYSVLYVNGVATTFVNGVATLTGQKGVTEWEVLATWSNCPIQSKMVKNAKDLPYGLGPDRYMRMRVWNVQPPPAGSYVQGYYLLDIEDSEDYFDGGWPAYSLDRDGILNLCDTEIRGGGSDCYNYFTSFIVNLPFDDEIAAQVLYLIKTPFVGTFARNCFDENNNQIQVTAAHVQEAIWLTIEGEVASDNCVVNELMGYAQEYAEIPNECGPQYRLIGLMPTYAFSHHGFQLMMFGLVVYTDVECCTPACPYNPPYSYCGWQPDGCGGIIYCGDCACVPNNSCPPDGSLCGQSIDDGCGEMIYCGDCECLPVTPVCEDTECGDVRKQDNCGNWYDLDCGPCCESFEAKAFFTCEWEEEEDPQWCSPGYWGRPQHLDSWDATRYKTTDSFVTIFGWSPWDVSVKSCEKILDDIKSGDTPPDVPVDPENPTLLEVLTFNNCYNNNSNGSFELVGDLLSEAHPDVNFLGNRGYYEEGEFIQYDCPLN